MANEKYTWPVLVLGSMTVKMLCISAVRMSWVPVADSNFAVEMGTNECSFLIPGIVRDW